MNSGRRGRALTNEERDLWDGVTRSIVPLRKRARKPAKAQPVPEPPAAAPLKGHSTAPVARLPAAAAKAVAAPAAPPPAGLDRRVRRKITKGTVAIDDRLDLHGLTQAQAHAALARFIHNAHAKGQRTLLVITGKGAPGGAPERGILRQQVPHWLSLAELRAVVQGFESAGRSHGGEGALYVKLRRPR